MASSSTPEQIGSYFENAVWETEPCDGVTAALREVAKHVATLEECEEGIYTQAENYQTADMVPGDEQGTVEDGRQVVDGEVASMAESETDTLVDRDEDAWSVVSDGDQNGRLYCDNADDESEVDEADDEREVDGIDNDADVDDEEQAHNANEDETLYGCTDDDDDEEEYLDNTVTNTDEEEHLDDCTEESIEVRELKKLLQDRAHEAWEYECDLERRHREELDYELETCKKEALKSKTELEKSHREELEDLNREHGKELNCLNTALEEKMQHVDMFREEIYRRRAFEVAKSQQLEVIKRQHKTECDQECKRADEAEQQLKDKLKDMQDKHHQELGELKRMQDQKYEHFVKIAADDIEKYRQRAARDAKLYADASEVLAAQITKAETMKAEYEKSLRDAESRYEQEVKRGNAERGWFSKQTHEVLGKTNKVNNENLKLRKELAEAVDDIQELVQKVRTDKAGHDQEMVRVKEEINRQHKQAIDELMDEHEQALDELVDEHAELADFLWEAENEIDELRQKEQEIEAKHNQEMSRVKADQQCLEGQIFDLMCKLVDVKQEAARLRDELKEAKSEVQELKEREQELVSQQGADRVMFERTLHAMRNMLQDSE